MNKNIPQWERILRWVTGTLGLAWAIAGGPRWAYASIYLIVTSVFGFCLIYFILRIRKTRRPDDHA